MTSSGSGQCRPAATARFRFSCTVLRANPRVIAITRVLAPPCARRSRCRNCLMVSFLFDGMPAALLVFGR